MNTLAYAGPGPWIVFVPFVWAAVIITVITVLRRFGGRRPHGVRGWGGPGAASAADDRSPIMLLGRRFAAGEIDEDEYWRRLTVLEEQFGLLAVGDKGRRA
ncbi:SHOCT domain-containing protein [Streptomyces laurentii]|uniref:SHOCT domain-containing protein n=1 Tax=Streptomyces laurentii TaxID=39478 RepID=UPI0036A2EDD2